MGASQSTEISQEDGLLNRFKHREERSIQQISKYAVAPVKYTEWDPAEITCIRYLSNGIRKIYVAQWSAAFYDDNGILGVHQQSGPISGELTTIDKSDAITMYSIYTRWQEYRKIAKAGFTLMGHHLK